MSSCAPQSPSVAGHVVSPADQHLDRLRGRLYDGDHRADSPQQGQLDWGPSVSHLWLWESCENNSRNSRSWSLGQSVKVRRYVSPTFQNHYDVILALYSRYKSVYIHGKALKPSKANLWWLKDILALFWYQKLTSPLFRFHLRYNCGSKFDKIIQIEESRHEDLRAVLDYRKLHRHCRVVNYWRGRKVKLFCQQSMNWIHTTIWTLEFSIKKLQETKTFWVCIWWCSNLHFLPLIRRLNNVNLSSDL